MHSVIQADRDAAGSIWRDFVARAGECIAENAIRSGGMDDGALVQAFAKHRTAGQAELAREEAAHEITIDQRDIAERWADELARLIGQMTGVEIGEHSNLNFPWQNAAEAARAALSTTPDLSRDEGRAG